MHPHHKQYKEGFFKYFINNIDEDSSTVVNVNSESLYTPGIEYIDTTTSEPITSEKITSSQRPDYIDKQLKSLLEAYDISDEYLEDKSNKLFLAWLEKYKILALWSLWDQYSSKGIDSTIFYTILSQIGVAGLQSFENAKIGFLKCFIDNDNLVLRQGAIEGISNINPRRALAILNEAEIKESNPVLRKIISSYKSQMELLLSL